MKSIWKFQLQIKGEEYIEMPEGAKILAIQEQHGWPHIWALVDTEAEKELRRFYTIGTGHPFDLPPSAKHVGTFQVESGNLVFHVFEN